MVEEEVVVEEEEKEKEEEEKEKEEEKIQRWTRIKWIGKEKEKKIWAERKEEKQGDVEMNILLT